MQVISSSALPTQQPRNRQLPAGAVSNLMQGLAIITMPGLRRLKGGRGGHDIEPQQKARERSLAHAHPIKITNRLSAASNPAASNGEQRRQSTETQQGH